MGNKTTFQREPNLSRTIPINLEKICRAEVNSNFSTTILICRKISGQEVNFKKSWFIVQILAFSWTTLFRSAHFSQIPERESDLFQNYTDLPSKFKPSQGEFKWLNQQNNKMDQIENVNLRKRCNPDLEKVELECIQGVDGRERPC